MKMDNRRHGAADAREPRRAISWSLYQPPAVWTANPAVREKKRKQAARHTPLPCFRSHDIWRRLAMDVALARIFPSHPLSVRFAEGTGQQGQSFYGNKKIRDFSLH
jgi:hypothetical protein